MTLDGLRMVRARVDGRDEAVLGAALEEWWLKLCEHGRAAEDWNAIIADLWPETGRLIGHVQNANEAVGFDRGQRVALSLSFVEEDFTSRDYAEVVDGVWDLLNESATRPAVANAVSKLSERGPISAHFCQYGGDGRPAGQYPPLEL